MRGNLVTKSITKFRFWMCSRCLILSRIHSFERYFQGQHFSCWNKIEIFLLLRVIHCSNFECIFRHLKEWHKGHSMVQNKDRTFIFHNPKQFSFFCDPYPLWHTVANFRFCGSSHSADGRYGDRELCSLKLQQRQELEISLFRANGVVISDSRSANQDVLI